MVRALPHKIAVITGGASGIGAGTARRFLAEGARVVIADIDRERGQARAAELGPNCVFKYTDVASRDDVTELVDYAVDRFGGLDVMMNNAGISGRMQPELLDDDFADFDRVMRVDLLGVMLGTQIAARHMKDHGGGSIINTTSIGGIQAGCTVMTYRAAKAGVIHFTKSAAIDLAQHAIRVNTIAPGGIPTAILSAATGVDESDDLGTTAAIRKEIAADRPLKMTASVDDIAAAAAYLGSDDARYVTGVVLPVDGGMTAGNPRNPLRDLIVAAR
ncbi:SDR family NAD(P)-dependent oxidoreductase [Mycolicibacterium austroafricanum]|uniref:SDR family NAD(P)-dependent oxidoreductase n=1 Tax=Mycolicibacterium austroafricanum TaxID=39687 RepID=UPI001CA31EA8|nr:glucose 1-dehydrogenase [Mycolicibacterium austroafricanum]QZT63046.1 glucose 1-dehydrogenase [Mycolicibacterium austroafricanum]